MFARTDRLLLRPGWIEDAPAVAQIAGDLQLSVASAEDAARLLTHMVDPMLPHMLIWRRTAGAPELIGRTSLQRDAEKNVEFKLSIARAWRNRGYAAEAGRAVIEMARHALGLTEIVARPLAEDQAAHRLLSKLGFVPAGSTVYPDASRSAILPSVLFRRQLLQDIPAEPRPLAA